MQMRWAQLLSATRLGSRKNHTDQARSPFHKDYDRIIFSQSFRQLNRKTQVHPLSLNDAIHTRLTHSLEVSCIGRSLGMLAAEKIRNDLPDWIDPSDVGAIIQAACLAHDIGNPPFGHAGEYAIRDWFGKPEQAELLTVFNPAEAADLCQFEGNAQGMRILTRLEYHPNQGGMRLTYATLGAYLKYPWVAQSLDTQGSLASHRRAKFGCYQSEKEFLQQIGEQLGLVQTGDYAFSRHPLAYLLEAADDICYGLIDLEDGLLLGMLDYRDVEPLFLQLIGDYGVPDELTNNMPVPQKLAALRGRAMNSLVDAIAEAFRQQQVALLNGELKGTLLDHCSAHLRDGIENAKRMARQRIFTHPQKARLELVASSSLQVLLDAFIPLGINRAGTTFRDNRLVNILEHMGATLNGTPYQNTMQILDVITALSDHQAFALSQDIQGNRNNLF